MQTFSTGNIFEIKCEDFPTPEEKASYISIKISLASSGA